MPSSPLVPAAQLVKIPDGVDFQTAAAAMLQGMTAHYLTHSTLPLQDGRYLPGACRGGRRRRTHRADGQDARVRASSAPYPPRKRPASRAKPGPTRSSCTPRRISGRGEAPHRRPRGGRDLRLGGRVHLYERARFAFARAALMALFGQSSGPVAPLRSDYPERQGIAVPHASQPGALHASRARNCCGAPATCCAGSPPGS